MEIFRKAIKKIKSIFIWELLKEQAEIKNELAEIKRLAQSQVEISQRILQQKYTDSHLSLESKPKNIQDIGFRVHSQFDEDGLLLYIFSIIGGESKKCVEIGTSDGTECNTANLIIYHGWRGLLIDGDQYMVNKGKAFFASHPHVVLNHPRFVQSWVTRDNINETILSNGFQGPIDLLSIDIDGNDYHILEAINVIHPRVIVCEIQSCIPLDKAITIPYKEDFYCWNKPYPESEFRSMSMYAANKLLKSKGYRLVASHRFGFNLIFIKNGEGENEFPEINLETARGPYFNYDERMALWEKIKDYPWREV